MIVKTQSQLHVCLVRYPQGVLLYLHVEEIPRTSYVWLDLKSKYVAGIVCEQPRVVSDGYLLVTLQIKRKETEHFHINVSLKPIEFRLAYFSCLCVIVCSTA